MDSNRSERRPEGGRGRKDAPDSERRRLEGANRRFETGSRVLPQLKEKTPVNAGDFFSLKHNDLKACMDSKRNERAEQWRRQNRTDAVLVNAAAVKGAHTMCATVTASPTPAKQLNACVVRI